MALSFINTEAIWQGERIDGILYPRNIEQLWTVEELAAIGLEKYVPPPKPYEPPSPGHVNNERDQRIHKGHSVVISDGRTINVQTRDDRDFRNLNGLVSQAIVYTIMQQQATMLFRDADDTIHEVTPAQMIEIGSLVAAKVQAIYEKAWAIKELDPIPDDYDSDERWL